MEPGEILEYLAAREIPESFEWPENPTFDDALETVEIVGTIQAGNREEIHILVGGLVMRLPTEAVVGISDATVGPQGSSRLVVSVNAVAEARTRMLLLPQWRDDVPPLVLEDGTRPVIDTLVYSDETLRRFEDIVEKLRRLGLPVPIGPDIKASTYCYLSSAIATPGPDGGYKSDSDPIRISDD